MRGATRSQIERAAETALAAEFIADLPRAMAAIGDNENVRVAIIAGRGKSFCVGIDLASLGSAPDLSTTSGCMEQFQHTRLCQDGITAIAQVVPEKPS